MTPKPRVAGRFEPQRRQYLSLGLGELFAAVVFAVFIPLAPFVTADGARPALLFALAPLIVILIAAGIYWLIARHSIPRPLPHGAARAYRALRLIVPVMLVACGLGAALTWPGLSPSAFLIVVIWLFAVAEYINYFLVRLSYPWAQWAGQVGRWSTPRLVRDVRAAL